MGPFKCYIMQWVEIFDVMKVCGPTLLALRGGVQFSDKSIM